MSMPQQMALYSSLRVRVNRQVSCAGKAEVMEAELEATRRSAEGCNERTVHHVAKSGPEAALRVKLPGSGGLSTACRASKLGAGLPEASARAPGPISSLSDFVQGEEIYSGRETRVISCLTKLTRRPVVVKVSSKSGMTARQKRLVEKEVRLSKKLSIIGHSGVVALLNAFEDEHNYYQVLEFCDQGNLYDALHSNDGPFSEEVVCLQVVRPLLASLAFLHSHGIVHRDVKLENLLLAGGTLKLADFGLAVDTDEEEPRIRVGTIDYNAPEVACQPSAAELEAAGEASVPPYTAKVDVWAAGIVAFELLVGHAPFYMPCPEDTTRLIQEGTLPGFLGFLSSDCVDFLHAALRKDPSERPSAEELLKHPWVRFHGDSSSDDDAKKGNQLPTESESSTMSSMRWPAVATFDTPNHSLSPRLGTWKIQTQASLESRPGSAHTPTSRLQRLLHKEASKDLQDTAEDVQPRTPAPADSSTNGSARTVSYVDVAPQLGVLREEVAESAFGAPVETDPSAEPTPDAVPAMLIPAPLLKTMSTGKSRFA